MEIKVNHFDELESYDQNHDAVNAKVEQRSHLHSSNYISSISLKLWSSNQ